MPTISSLLIMFILFTGCDGTYDNSPATSKPSFSISLAPAFAPSAVTDSVAVNAQLILYASSTLEPSTVNESSVFIQSASGVRHAAYITLVGQDIIVQPKVYLTPNTKFEIVATTAIASTNGAHLTNNAVVFFTSGNPSLDVTAPTITSSLPHDSVNSAHELFTKIYFQFDEPISPLNTNNNTITVTATNIDINISGTVNVSGSLISFTPDQNIPNDDTNWNIFLNLNDISDLAGNGPATVTSVSNDVNKSFWSSVTLAPKPLSVNSYNLGTAVNCIESSDNLLFIGSNDGLYLMAFDSTTTIFSPKSHLDQASIGMVYSIDINATTNRAYIGSTTGLFIIDISDSARPLIISHYPTTYPVYGVDQNGTDLYLAASLQGFIILDMTDETTLTEKYPTSTTLGTAFDVLSFDTGILLVEYDQGMSNYGFTGKLADQYPFTTTHLRSLLAIPNHNYIYMAAGIGGVYSVDPASTLTPTPVQQMPSYTTKLVTDGALVYSNDYGTGIGVFSGSTSLNLLEYIPLDFDVVTITYTTDGSKKHLVLVGVDGRLYSIEI